MSADAWSDFWAIVDEYEGIRGVIHCFSSGSKQLTAALKRDLHIGLNGIMTFTRDEAQLEAARQVPKERLVLETDAPFLTPEPIRNETCEPRHTLAVAEFLANLRDESVEDLAAYTTKNAVKLFGLKMSGKIYLDYAAATPMDRDVLATMQPYSTDNFYNPSATYLAARSVKNDLNEFRSGVAKVLGARPAEIVFTAGASEANNLAIQGIMNNFPDGEVLVSQIEHDSVLAPAGSYRHQTIPVDDKGVILLNKLSNLITDKTVLISVMLVNNELGTIQPLSELTHIIKSIKQKRLADGNKLPLYLHTDAAQAVNYLDLHVSRLGVDLMSLNGGKIYGPKQSGCLYVAAGTRLKPMIVGGGQEFNMRSGTENLAGIAGFCKALQLAAANRPAELKRITELRQEFEKQITDQVQGASINGSSKHRAPHIISLTITGTDNERLMMELDEQGVMCAVGSACSASSDEPSHVLKAIGLSDSQARSTLRFSLGRQTTKDDIGQAVQLVAKITASNR